MSETLGQALEREHREIDEGIGRFAAGGGRDGRAELLAAVGQLRRHIYLEEDHVFPPLEAAGMVGPVFVMTREHGEIWQWLDAVEAAADGPDPSVAAARCRELVALLDAHNGKEEAIVYAAADQLLAPGLRADLEAVVATAALPDGWVCHQLRG